MAIIFIAIALIVVLMHKIFNIPITKDSFFIIFLGISLILGIIGVSMSIYDKGKFKRKEALEKKEKTIKLIKATQVILEYEFNNSTRKNKVAVNNLKILSKLILGED